MFVGMFWVEFTLQQPSSSITICSYNSTVHKLHKLTWTKKNNCPVGFPASSSKLFKSCSYSPAIHVSLFIWLVRLK